MVLQIVVSMWNLLLNVLLVYENSIMDKDVNMDFKCEWILCQSVATKRE